MRCYVQDSKDGKEWRDLWLIGGRVILESKKVAKQWFDALCDVNNLDWRIGFLVRFRDGTYYRVVDKNSQVVKYK